MINITNNGYTAKILNFGLGEYGILVSELSKLDGHTFAEFYRKLRSKYSLDKYKRHTHGCTRRNIYLTLDGCIAICEMFREPNDELIKKIKNTKTLLEHQKFVETISKKPDAEAIVEMETKRLENEKLDFNKLEGRISLLEVKTNDIVAGVSISTSQFKGRIEDLENKLEDLENNLSYLNDKPNQQDTSFRTLLKECIKEIIKEELQK